MPCWKKELLVNNKLKKKKKKKQICYVSLGFSPVLRKWRPQSILTDLIMTSWISTNTWCIAEVKVRTVKNTVTPAEKCSAHVDSKASTCARESRVRLFGYGCEKNLISVHNLTTSLHAPHTSFPQYQISKWFYFLFILGGRGWQTAEGNLVDRPPEHCCF